MRNADLVLEGGGMKGIALAGAVAELEAHGYRFKRMAGTSAGSIGAALLAAGIRGAEIEKLMLELPLLDFADMTLVDRIPLLGPTVSIVRENGWLEGEVFRNWLADLLAAHGVVTFADVREHDRRSHLEDDRRYRLVVTATDLTRGELVYLPWDYRRLYGLDPDTQLVADAVRASISVPFVFEPVVLHPADGHDVTLVDGGVLSNFPIDVFDRTDGTQPRWPTFGVKLIHRFEGEDMRLLPKWLPRPGPVRMVEALVATAIVGRDQRRLNMPSVQARTITVDTTPVGVLEFWAGDEQKRALLRTGHEAAAAFLAGWSWDAHREVRQSAA